MDFRDTVYCKIISSIVLFAFIWTFVGGADMAYAMKHGLGTGKNLPDTPAREKSHAVKFTEALNSIEAVLEDPSLDMKGKKGKLAAYKTDLIGYDTKMRQKFKEAEKHIKDKGLAEAVLKRHQAFVNHYEQNYGQLKKNIEDLLADIPAQEFEKKRQEVLKQLERVRPPKKHIPLDPTKLPHRAAEDKKAPTEEWTPPKPPKLKLTPRKQSLLERPEADNPYSSLYEPFEGYPVEPILVASNGSLSGLAAGSITQSTPPSAEDLAETIDVQFTPAIMAKAAELANTPQAKNGALPIVLYEWVRNNVEYVPTWGSIQGADHCLQTMKCNSFDTASLMIALYRANGIHARYATGTFFIDIKRFMNWMGGFTDPNAALSFAASGGMPVTGLVEGGQIKAVRFEQVIVLGWVDMFPSRGAKHKEGDYWIRFDPSFKEYEYTQGIDLSQAVPFDAEGLVATVVDSATINEEQGYVTDVDSSLIEQAVAGYRSQLEQYMVAEHPDATVGDVLGTKTIIKHEFPILMGTLPYKTETIHARYREIPDSLRHKITFSVEPQSSYYYVEPFTLTKSLPELAGKKITLSYSPATPDDEAIINSYMPEPHPDGTPIDPSELPTSLPAYLINLKPELRINGQVVATGGTITMGTMERFNMTFTLPRLSGEVVSNLITAGDYLGIAVDTGHISKEQMLEMKSRLESTKARLEAEDFSGLAKDDILGDMLFSTAMSYYAELDVMDYMQSKALGVNTIRLPSEGIFSLDLSTEELFGVVVSAGPGGMVMDVDRAISVNKAVDGNREKATQFMLASGMNSSALEHAVPEQLFSTEENPAEGISAVKALKLASEQGIPIYTITKDNISTALSQLQLDSQVIMDIRNAVNAGREVTVSKTEITYNGWTGCGYIIVDTVTGAGAYMISGGMNGAFLTFLGALLIVLGMFLLGTPLAPVGVYLIVKGVLVMSLGINLIMKAGGQTWDCMKAVMISITSIFGFMATIEPPLGLFTKRILGALVGSSVNRIGRECFGSGIAY